MVTSSSFAFLHGGGNGGWVWDETIDALSIGDDSTQVLRLDVPGCGSKRGRHTDEISTDDIVAELIGDIEAAGMHDVVLVGHSQAGSILPKMVTMRPDLFRRVVYVTCSSPLNGQSVVDMIGGGLHGEDPDKIGWPIDPRASSPEERYSIMFCNDMSPTEEVEFLAKLGKDMWPMESYGHTSWSYEDLGAVPASYVVCLKDNILPVHWQRTFAERFRCDRVVEIDAGHQVMNTRPHELAQILTDELARG
jgi:pimeloyl-ACP methyl ester carboxylesterase